MIISPNDEMAAPSLSSLPPELLDEVVQASLPEGFESLAFTCKSLHKSCIPFIALHNSNPLHIKILH